jgi:tetrahydromethanopterin S-methyltransferase subunit H
MFRLSTPPKICRFAGIEVGGQPGERPPLLIANMFQTGDKLFISRKDFDFDRDKAKARLKELEEISATTGIPAMVGMVAPKGYDEMRVYTEFFLENSPLPFAVDTWTEKARLETARFIADQGLQDRFLYNSITAWDKDIPGQVAKLKEFGIKHVIVQAFDLAGDKRPSGRVKSLDRLLPMVEKGNFESILIDTSVMNLPTIGFSLIANKLVKEKYGWPSGCAPANGSYMWLKGCSEKWGVETGRDVFRGADAGLHALATILWTDWMVYGPMTGTRRIFGAVASAMAVLAMLVYEEGAGLPAAESHPLHRLWPEVAKQLREAEEVKSDVQD